MISDRDNCNTCGWHTYKISDKDALLVMMHAHVSTSYNIVQRCCCCSVTVKSRNCLFRFVALKYVANGTMNGMAFRLRYWILQNNVINQTLMRSEKQMASVLGKVIFHDGRKVVQIHYHHGHVVGRAWDTILTCIIIQRVLAKITSVIKILIFLSHAVNYIHIDVRS